MTMPLSPAVYAFTQELDLARREVAGFRLADARPKSSGGDAQINDIMDNAGAELDTLRERVMGKPAGDAQDNDAAIYTRLAWRLTGRHVELVTRLNQQWFTIDASPSKSDPGLNDDIAILATGVPIPADVGLLKQDLDTTLTVVKSVLNDRRSRIGNSGYGARVKELRDDQNDYMDQLLGIARVGLMTSEPSLFTFARGDLARLQTLFTIREAGKVKNDYLVHLAKCCGAATVLFVGLYFLCQSHADLVETRLPGWGVILRNTRNFHLLAAGTAVGTWLSFSLRRQELTFSDLAVLEPDRLDPAARVLFMIGLASFVGLLLFTNAVIAGVGSVTGFDAMHQHGSWALLVGLLAGVAERGLGSAVQRRSNDFAAVIGGDGLKTAAKV